MSIDAAELVETAQTDHLGISTVSFAMFGLRRSIVDGVARNSLVAQVGGNFSMLQPALAFAVFSLLALLISNNVARSWSSSPLELRSLLDSAARETYRQVRHPSQGLRALLEPGRDVQNVVSGGCQRLVGVTVSTLGAGITNCVFSLWGKKTSAATVGAPVLLLASECSRRSL